MGVIKIAFRKNHIYLVFLFFSYFSRRILLIILNKLFGMGNSLIFCFFMCLGQIIGGLIIFLYQSAFLNKKVKSSESPNNKNKLELIKTEREMNIIDNNYKISFLIFLASFFDLIEFFITSDFIPKIERLPSTADLRLCFTMTISSSLFCIHALKYKIGKHQFLSLIILSICSIIIIILEFIYKPKDINLVKYFLSYLLLILHFVFRSLTDVIEKYLGEYDFVSPFQIIMSEGISTFIMTTIYAIFHNPFKEVSDIRETISNGEFAVLIFLLILYFVLCSFVNVYKTYCNVLYSPMAKSLGSYFLNSAFIIYYYVTKKEFFNEGKGNIFLFLINLIFSIVIDLFGLIYNEFFVLNFWGLSFETHQDISDRAEIHEMIAIRNTDATEDIIINDDNDGEE